VSHLDDARCCFIDGPVAIYLQQAPMTDLIEAYERLGRMVRVAAREMNEAVERPASSEELVAALKGVAYDPRP
jgi:hypothetical protein